MMRRARPVVLLALAAGLFACAHPASQAGLSRQGGFQAAGARHRVHAPGELELFVLPEAQDQFLLSAIDGARRVVRLQMYLLTHTGVMDALIAAKKRGVDVQVLLEARPFNPGNPNSPLPTNKRAAAYLAKGGVVAGWTSPSYNFTHAKAITIDDAVTYVSTANFTKSGLGAGGAYSAREYVIADRSPTDVAEFVAMFKADWAHKPYVPSDPDLIVSPNNARQRIFDLVKSARREVRIAVEVAADPAFNDLVAAKVKEGVRVKALLGDHNKIGINLDTARKWRERGADVRFQAKPFLHAKTIVVDGQVMYVGSTNLTTNSMDNNRELGLKIAAPEIVKGVLSTMEHDWHGGSEEPVNKHEEPFSWLEPVLL